MSDPKDGGPAFPRPKFWSTDGDPDHDGIDQGGMSLRDYFAAAALQAIAPKLGQWGEDLSDQDVATHAYNIADAMLYARGPERKAK